MERVHVTVSGGITGKTVIQNADQLFLWALYPAFTMKNKKFLFVSSTECQEFGKEQVNVKTIKRTMKAHAISSQGNCKILAMSVAIVKIT